MLDTVSTVAEVPCEVDSGPSKLERIISERSHAHCAFTSAICSRLDNGQRMEIADPLLQPSGGAAKGTNILIICQAFLALQIVQHLKQLTDVFAS